MTDLITALALAVAIEGALYSLFPEGMKKVMLHAIAQPPRNLRAAGIIAAVAGVGVVWLVRG